MAKLLKEIYFIEFEGCETGLCAKMRISKTEYNRQLTFLLNQVNKTIDEESEYKVEYREFEKEIHNVISKEYHFYNGTSTTHLIKWTTKDGFCFDKQIIKNLFER